MLWIMTAFHIGDMLFEEAPDSAARLERDTFAQLDIFKKIDAALAKQPGKAFYTFSAKYPNPFRASAMAGKGRGARKGLKAKAACTLFLKGILNKQSNPLAIIQDESGKTVISKKGDTVCEMKVIKIGTDSVVLRGAGGKQTLTLSDK